MTLIRVALRPQEGATSRSHEPAQPPIEPLDVKVQRVSEDLKELNNIYYVATSSRRASKLREYISKELDALKKFPFEESDQDTKVDYILLKGYLERQNRQIDLGIELDKQAGQILPFAGALVQLCEERALGVPMVGQDAAQKLYDTTKAINSMIDKIENEGFGKDMAATVAYRAARSVDKYRTYMNEWFDYYASYDPLFTWWVNTPFREFKVKLDALGASIGHKLVGIQPGENEGDAIVGEPIGREGLLAELKADMVAYSPEEILAIGEQEFEWCIAEMIKASQEMRCGDDWMSALEIVRNDHVDPGKQTDLVRDLAQEGTDFVEKHDLVTVPEIAKDTWMMYMMTPEQQKVNPFFLGGDCVKVSYPVSQMKHDEKMMSMRGNNIHFSRATVFHELIPGHRLQYYYNSRSRPYRQLFDTAFWVEGWSLYWEMILWDDPRWVKTPKNKIGMLFWRLHRCARIIFSISFHLGRMTAQECVDLLVNRAGHERATAEGEVRRSLAGEYSPLYQAGYMLGALQIYKLRKELVDTGLMPVKEFHNRFLRGNYMPIEMVRALLKGVPLDREYEACWRWYDFKG
ncbi:hypothetical protein KEM56_006510 [Ascosphaera pollenicola]|nr:hypothetical protein KEM56_006510 [Ascosphaera pollenicola]